MTSEHVRYEVTDRVGVVTIDRPSTLNALSHDVFEGLAAVLRDAAGDGALHALVVTGAGEKTFASGGDLVALSKLTTREEGLAMALHARGVLDLIRRFPAPVVAAVNGDALGGGAELALACDHRVVASHARIAFAQGRQALTTAWGGGPDLIRLFGPIVAMRLLADSSPIDHVNGLTIGIYDAAAGPDATLAETLDAYLAPLRRQKPHVLRTHKALAIEARMGGDRRVLEDIEAQRFADNWVHQDHWDALHAFLNRTRS